jgi:demethylmenaquinone methyltransferase/2-methoxy-6-polyprenyl-1,4-benzoquinol methylase
MDKQRQTQTPSRREVWKMFDRIAHRYDFLNHFLSLNRDVAWRRKMAAALPDGDALEVLDLATGTGDQLISLHQSGRVRSGTGIDLAEKMLEIGRQKIARLGLDGALDLRSGDAEAIPFDDNSFHATSISFGIRNVLDVNKSLAEMYRVLRPGGRALILEFSLPSNRLIRRLYLLYFRHVLPRLGRLVSGDAHAYNYLNQTVETFAHGDEFCELMRTAGFHNVKATPLTFGIASIYQGDKA